MSTQAKPENGGNQGSHDRPLRGRWRTLPERSQVGFRVKKMGLYRFKGRFNASKGQLKLPPAAAVAHADILIDAGSISTWMPPRDLHLRSADFLDVKQHPHIRVSAGFRRARRHGLATRSGDA